MDLLALVGLAALLLVKEAGVPVPVPGDLLVIGAGIALAGSPSPALLTLAVILAVGYLGGSIQFLLARRLLRGPLLAALARIGVGESRVEGLAARLRRSGGRGVALARMTPGVSIAAIVAAGLAALPFAAFLGGLVIGNGVFVAGHFALGYLLGASATEVIGNVGAFGAVAVAMIVLAVIGAAGWVLIRRARHALSPRGAAVADWTDAACPACLAVAAVRVRTERPVVQL